MTQNDSLTHFYKKEIQKFFCITYIHKNSKLKLNLFYFSTFPNGDKSPDSNVSLSVHGRESR